MLTRGELHVVHWPVRPWLCLASWGGLLSPRNIQVRPLLTYPCLPGPPGAVSRGELWDVPDLHCLAHSSACRAPGPFRSTWGHSQQRWASCYSLSCTVPQLCMSQRHAETFCWNLDYSANTRGNQMAKGQGNNTISKTQSNMAPPEPSYPTTASPGYLNITKAQENDLK